MDDKEKIIELYKAYWDQMIDKDTDGLDALMADDYELIHMTGKRQGKEIFFASLMSGELNYYSAVHDEILTDVTGSMATLVGKSQVIAAVYGGGKNKWRLHSDFSLRKEDDVWKLVSCKVSTY